MAKAPADRTLLTRATRWFAAQGWKPQIFQRDAWKAYLQGAQGLLTAPTGMGKTYALLVPILLEALREGDGTKAKRGLRAIWIAPIRALTKEIELSAWQAIAGLGLDWTVGVRTGDTSANERTKQKKAMPEILITTPESLHVLLSQKGGAALFERLRCVVVDEWHELLGSKRAVQMELALSRMRSLAPGMRTWGISATIGNLEEALDVLLGEKAGSDHRMIIRGDVRKRIEVRTVLPPDIRTFPWAGHAGVRAVEQVMPLLHQGESTLIFTNTRSFAERWYQRMLDVDPELSGLIALHHGSLSRELRDWTETALHEHRLRAVICTSSLDLGVDFRPVSNVVQVGGPKNVARFIQRAGRSGHQPRAVSRIHFVPTHAMELLEGVALRHAVAARRVEQRIPYTRSFDVLCQYLVTLAVGDGFRQEEVLKEVRGTFSFRSITPDEWNWVLGFITTGGPSLLAYDEFRKVEVEDGRYVVNDRRIALRHRLSIGTITSDTAIRVKYISGGYIGSLEESFISRLKRGDVFWFAGRNLEFLSVHNMEALVRKSEVTKGRVPSWMGGRMPLSSQMSAVLREVVQQAAEDDRREPELRALAPLLEKQRERSHIPRSDELLVEKLRTREGYHVFLYPFEGRAVHEGMAALLAYRIGLLTPITFSIAMNDYGFELLSDRAIPIEAAFDSDLFSTAYLRADIEASLNATEMARRRFREIAQVAGLVFKGFKSKAHPVRHLQSSAQLFFEVFREMDPANLLLMQAHEEVMTFQLEEARLRAALERIHQQRPVIMDCATVTPFCFPILVDRLREKLSSEKLEERIQRMTAQLA
ncbi:MAG: ligase-associated DNA damage response DEXH box helicase [Flavobacteriales bacterium]|nr:ligase-associated DNA damage response DEXH box helicase [Flavobacteriales bacterium]